MQASPHDHPHVPPPTKHQLALMIWVAVFPTLTVLNLALGDTLADLPSVLRTLVLATVAVRSSSTASCPACTGSGYRAELRRDHHKAHHVW